MTLHLEPTLWRQLELHADSVVDGDTLRVHDPDPEAWGAQLGRLHLGVHSEVVLRLSALDAPESRYPGGPPDLDRQPAAATAIALSELQRELGQCRDGRLVVRLSAVDRYGRALVLVWPAATAPASDRDCDAAALAASLNARLLAAGACFPDFHDDLPRGWITQLAALARAARLNGRGLWPLDRSLSGVALADRAGLAQHQLVLPRLFRRIADFWRQQGATDAPLGRKARAALGDCFREWLEQRGGTLRVREGGPPQPFAEWVEIRDGRCRVTGHVENFLYQSCPPDQKLT